MPLKLISPPTVEPVSLAEAKLHLRVDDDFTADDLLIKQMIRAARTFAEQQCQVSICAQRWRQVLDSFPGPSLIGVPYGKAFTMPGHSIQLEVGQVVSVEAINYLDMSSTQRLMPESDYAQDLACWPARITPVFGKIWPINVPQIGSVWVDFISGHVAEISVDATANEITVKGWKALEVGEVVRFSNSGGALPAPLAEKTDYYVVNVSGSVIKVSDTEGGAPIDLSDTGSGTSFLGERPDGMIAWMLCRIAAMYENREEVGLDMKEMPFIDSLLDPHRMVLG